ncbi:MAG: hypothetical protein GF400_09955 [Candidatus Eisenbacteria bacterium]|nr:hypothetical protein [Candidatus Eisenbacteria bacterium]
MIVIWESSYWKRELFYMARDLRRRMEQKRWQSASLARIELHVMLGFYMIRKMIEARKISDEIPAREMRVALHPPTGTRVTYQNAHKISRLYDMGTVTHEIQTVRYVCNQIVHSFVFVPLLREHAGWDGVLFASDRQRQQGAYYLSSEDIIDLFEKVAFNDPADYSWTIDEETGQEIIKVGPSLQ